MMERNLSDKRIRGKEEREQKEIVANRIRNMEEQA